MSIKSNIRKLIPYSLITAYRRHKRIKSQKLNVNKSTEQVFSEIYKENAWGGEKGDFYSGGGTTIENIANKYVEYFDSIQSEFKLSELAVVDLGCGDMRIGGRIAPLFRSYTGVDVVKDLIQHHNEKLASPSVSFKHLNIVDDELPEGDVCLVREVMQHLSNEQILEIIPKLGKYKYVFVTEHIPTPNPDLKFNLDKPHGGDVRLYDNSGVYLTKPPFNVLESKVEKVLEVEGHRYENYEEPWIKGTITTVLYRPGK